MATARPRPQVMRLTDAAALRIKDVMARADKPVAGVRVGVKNGGCAGMEYTMEYAVDIKPTDEVVEDKGVKILVDPKAVLFLLGTEMDYKTEKLASPTQPNGASKKIVVLLLVDAANRAVDGMTLLGKVDGGGAADAAVGAGDDGDGHAVMVSRRR